MRRALVTGGSGAIGAAICRKLAADGHYVYVHANAGGPRAETIASEIAALGGAAKTVIFDVTDHAATAKALASLLDAGPLQILVNNAGVHDDAVMPGMAHEQWSRVIDVSLNGFFNVTQPLLMPMIQTRWGRIINISSVAAIVGNRGQVNYVLDLTHRPDNILDIPAVPLNEVQIRMRQELLDRLFAVNQIIEQADLATMR